MATNSAMMVTSSRVSMFTPMVNACALIPAIHAKVPTPQAAHSSSLRFFMPLIFSPVRGERPYKRSALMMERAMTQISPTIPASNPTATRSTGYTSFEHGLVVFTSIAAYRMECQNGVKDESRRIRGT